MRVQANVASGDATRSVPPVNAVDESELLARLRREPRRVVVVGNYGSVNLGDEMLLSVVSRWIRDAGGSAVAVTVSPDHTSEMHGIDAVWYADLPAIVEAVASADLLVLGGGGLFQDYDVLDPAAALRFPAFEATQFAQYVFLARTLGVTSVALAQGVGPLRSDGARALVRDVYGQMARISLRDTASAGMLRELGIGGDFDVAPDPGWSWPVERVPSRPLRTIHPELAGRKVLGVVLRDWPFDADWEDRFVQAFRAALPDDWSCLWLDFFRAPLPLGAQQPESTLARRLIDRLGEPGRHVIWRGATIEDAYAQLAQCDAALAMRMHAVLLAHRAGLPVVSIEYEEKMTGLNDAIGMPPSQRLSVAEVGDRLRPALQVVTGPDCARAFRMDRKRAAGAGVAAEAHRTVLWEAMAATDVQAVAGAADAKRLWLAEWHREADADVRRVIGALEARLHRESAALVAARALGRSARADIGRLEQVLQVTERALATERKGVAIEESEVRAWRARYEAIRGSRSYRWMAPARAAKALVGRAIDAVRGAGGRAGNPGPPTARTKGLSPAVEVTDGRTRRALLPDAVAGAAFADQLEVLLASHQGKRIAVLLPAMDRDVPLLQQPQPRALAPAEHGHLHFYCVPATRDGVHGFREIADGVVLTDQLDLMRALLDAAVFAEANT